MPRYIETTDAIRVLSEYYNYRTDDENCRLAIAISNVPTADVREVKHGRWKMTDAFPHWLYCDQCFKRIVPNANWIEEYDIPTNFCPNCGADMRKETEDAKEDS